jgi:hypothetical protein
MQIITSAKTLVQQSETYGPIAPENQNHKRLIDEELKGDEEIDEKLGMALRAIWRDPGIQATYDQRANFQLTDSTKYFFDRIDEVIQERETGC